MEEPLNLLSWLRSTIEGDKAAAEAAGAPRRVGVRVKDENGYRWDKKPVDYSGEWQVAEAGDAVEPVCPEAEAIVSASCGCCCSTSEGLEADLKHIAVHDPRDTIARCTAELALLGLHEPNAYGDCASGCIGSGGFPCATFTALLSGYRHRPGFKPEWVGE